MSQRIGKKIPNTNSHPCPFLSVISPRVNRMVMYKRKPRIPTPHHIVRSFE
jgi:hypothetical protein